MNQNIESVIETQPNQEPANVPEVQNDFKKGYCLVLHEVKLYNKDRIPIPDKLIDERLDVDGYSKNIELKEFIFQKLKEIELQENINQEQSDENQTRWWNKIFYSKNKNIESKNNWEELKELQRHFKENQEDTDMPEEYKKKFLDDILDKIVQNDQMKGHIIKDVFNYSKFGRQIDHVSYQDKEIMIARHYCPEVGLILSLLRMKEQKTGNEKYDHRSFIISNERCKDASLIGYVQHEHNLMFYQKEEDKMILRAIDIRTGLYNNVQLDKFVIKFDKDQLQIHSVIFNQDHIGEKPEEIKGFESFLKSLFVGVIFSRAESKEKIHLQILKLENNSSEDEIILFFKSENGDQKYHIEIPNVSEQTSLLENYPQNNIKIQVLEDSKSQQEKNRNNGIQILVSHGIWRQICSIFQENNEQKFKMVTEDCFELVQESKSDKITKFEKLVKQETNQKCISQKGDRPKKVEINDLYFTKQLIYQFEMQKEESMSNEEASLSPILYPQTLLDVLSHIQPEHSDTWSLIKATPDDPRVIRLSAVSLGIDISQEFPLSFSSHSGVSAVKLVEGHGRYFAIFGQSNSGDVKVVHKDGYVITQIDGATWYLGEYFNAICFKKKQEDASKFEIDKEGKILKDGTAVAIGYSQTFIKSMDWDNEEKQQSDNLCLNKDGHLLITSTSLTLLKNQCRIAYITGQNNQDITVLSVNLIPNIDSDSYSPNEKRIVKHEGVISKYIKNIWIYQENGWTRIFKDEGMKSQLAYFTDDRYTLDLQFEKLVHNLNPNEKQFGFCSLSNQKITNKNDKKIIQFAVKDNDSHYIKIYHTEVQEGSITKITGCSTLIGLTNQSFKDFDLVTCLYDESQTGIGIQIKQNGSKKKFGIRCLRDEQFQIKNDDLLQVGYEVVHLNCVNFIRFDIQFSQKSNFNFLPPKSQQEILTKCQQIFMNLDLFNFATILIKDRFIPEDIFQLSEALNLHSGYEYFLLTPKRFEGLDATKNPISNSIYDQLPWLNKSGKREKHEIRLNFELESPLDGCINLEESEVSLEILTKRLIEMSRSKESNAILMSHLYRCMQNKKFSKNLVELLKDLKAIEEIGEEETIFLKTKFAWHLKEISDYAENLPKICSYPHNPPPELANYKIFGNLFDKFKREESAVFPDYHQDSEKIKQELKKLINKQKSKDGVDFISQLKEQSRKAVNHLKKLFGYGNKKQKGTFSFIDFTLYKIAREIESQSEGRRAGSFTHMEVALITKNLNEKYLSETKNMKTLRDIIDYHYWAYTFRVQMFEFVLVVIQIIIMRTRLFVQRYNSTKFSFIQFFGEFGCTILLFIIQLAKLYSLGPSQMYWNSSFKFLTDLVYPIAAFVYFIKFKDLKLMDYDRYEKQKNSENILQDIIDEKGFEKINKIQSEEGGDDFLCGLLENQKTEYFIFVFYSVILCSLIFIKFKYQLQMSTNMNSVIQLIEYSLSDAIFFLFYYGFLMLFFCVLFMVQGSVILSEDYAGLDSIGDIIVRYPYYIIQGFRNSIGDLQTPKYQFWDDFSGVKGKIMIYIIWLTWMVNILYCSLLMLNFLITVFSETHERVLANKINYTYLTRATLNVECLGMLKTLGFIQDFDYFVICSPVDDELEDEVDTLGVVTCLTSVIKEYSIKIGAKINQIQTQIKAQFAEMNSKVEAQNAEMNAQNAQMKAEMSAMKGMISKILKLVEAKN